MNSYIEYAILRIVNGGAPYVTTSYKSFEKARYILDTVYIEDHRKKKKLFYVDNDFFNNDFPNLVGSSNFYYYKIVERKVTTWETYQYFERNSNINKREKKNKILKFPILA